MSELNKKLFLALNGDLGAFADSFFVFISSNFSFAIMAVIALFIIFFKYGKKECLFAFFSLLLVILISDQTANFFKINFPTYRPIYTADIQTIIHYVPSKIYSGLFGTVSGHAANGVGIAIFTLLVVKNRYYTIFSVILTLLICYSRIYLGAHFPSDLLFGTILGAISGPVCYLIYNKALNKTKKKNSITQTNR